MRCNRKLRAWSIALLQITILRLDESLPSVLTASQRTAGCRISVAASCLRGALTTLAKSTALLMTTPCSLFPGSVHKDFKRRYAHHFYAFADPFVTCVNRMMGYMAGNVPSCSGDGLPSTPSLSAAGVPDQNQSLSASSGPPHSCFILISDCDNPIFLRDIHARSQFFSPSLLWVDYPQKFRWSRSIQVAANVTSRPNGHYICFRDAWPHSAFSTPSSMAAALWASRTSRKLKQRKL